MSEIILTPRFTSIPNPPQESPSFVGEASSPRNTVQRQVFRGRPMPRRRVFQAGAVIAAAASLGVGVSLETFRPVEAAEESDEARLMRLSRKWRPLRQGEPGQPPLYDANGGMAAIDQFIHQLTGKYGLNKDYTQFSARYAIDQRGASFADGGECSTIADLAYRIMHLNAKGLPGAEQMFFRRPGDFVALPNGQPGGTAFTEDQLWDFMLAKNRHNYPRAYNYNELLASGKPFIGHFRHPRKPAQRWFFYIESRNGNTLDGICIGERMKLNINDFVDSAYLPEHYRNRFEVSKAGLYTRDLWNPSAENSRIAYLPEWLLDYILFNTEVDQNLLASWDPHKPEPGFDGSDDLFAAWSKQTGHR